MIIIIGSQEDIRSAYVINELLARKVPFSVFDTTQYPYHSHFTLSLTEPMTGSYYTTEMKEKIPLSDIQSIYFCTQSGFQLQGNDPPEVQSVVYNNIDSAVWSFFRSLDCLVVNPIVHSNDHNYKTFVLKDLQKAGIRIPATTLTNNPDEVLALVESSPFELIVKPPWGQAFTEKITKDHLKKERLATLANSPVMIQEYIPGQDFRAYVIGTEIFFVEIQSKTLDLNLDAEAKRVATTMPDSVKADCFKIAEVSQLVFTAIDFRRTPDGEYVYFEANSSPDFSTDQEWTNYPLCQSLVDLLTKAR